MEKKYLIIEDYGTAKIVPEITIDDLLKMKSGTYTWLINLQTEDAFSPKKNAWIPLKDFPII